MRRFARMRRDQPIACVLGDMDLIRPLGLAGIPCAPIAPPAAATTFSRHAVARIDKVDQWEQPERQVEILLRFARAQAQPPVLYYQADAPLLMVSRHRDRLREGFRFVIADAKLVEGLVDKARFRELAGQLDLPVPRSRWLLADTKGEDLTELEFPVVVKPLTRNTERWAAVGGPAKAVRLNRPEDVRPLAARLAASGMNALVQELVEGPETRIESYHAYIDERGDVVGEFTGRKIRTLPASFGHSTAVEITASADVARAGLDVLRRLDLRGVAKLDFKRAPDGRLRLLEVNPRFNLWHHPAAVAGMNLPALVHADLTGSDRPATSTPTPGVRWCDPRADFTAARAAGIPGRTWLGFLLRSQTYAIVALDDPLPFACGRMAPALRRLAPRRRTGGGDGEPD
jgi:predicted ATP-grasp superfamily ATP-dependent carboligase